MDLLKMVLNAAGNQGGGLEQIANSVGIDQSQASSVLGQLVPALTRGLQRNTQSTEGLENLIFFRNCW